MKPHITCSLAVLKMAATLVLTGTSSAIPLTIHGTGEGLSLGDLDPNWTVTLPNGVPFGNAVAATSYNGDWAPPAAGYSWIGLVAQGNADYGVYRYSTTFNIAPGLDPATAQIEGYWWTDDAPPENGIVLNGILVSDFNGAAWNNWNAANAYFSITTGFVTGLNTLTYVVSNSGGGPTGMLLQNVSASADANGVPDAGATALLMVVGLFGLGAIRKSL